ncbi:cupin domain-containing protein [Campylobacter sp. RM9344]|uniref:Cupin domain-containing protein n=1 Tax=Campylobacter californiensis TaxID=1032243 RepID=A0AAW3ZU68_9BACT|nr:MULTISPECIES: cupin domain-containing protein [unclassified Campylobacter]MBE2984679.1 cupin domain-containing protein [Campylobacter sp. RM6883]MBE2986442.1 cupin domain-containing protein [Campylobacter sp. RM12919]MBE2987843.1 cupin domain-containing protein [Campylobacter sp. RM12920]MBE2994595.1 cupin domain-containing protein [Campylobacter sp. RM6913]MBE3022835.1 cupin domain-containing protein [Campylobacter sp. 7477a]MBE3029121.1 cupin domain-containing protein [Campylobacter sp. 
MAKIYNFTNDILMEHASIVSQRLFINKILHTDIYALDEGEEIDKEKLFSDCLAWVVHGEILLTYDTREVMLKTGESCLIENGVWRKFVAKKQSKLILITFKENVMIEHLDKAAVFSLVQAVGYQDGKVVSKTLVKNDKATVTLMSFGANTQLSTHAAPGDALLVALDGELDLTIGDEKFNIKEGDSIVMPGKVPHGLKVMDKFKMLLIVTRD